MSSEQENKLEGEYKSFHDNGQTKTRSFYKSGKLEGEYKMWYDNGRSMDWHYYQDGRLEGVRKIWRSYGDLWVQVCYRNGKIEGEYRWGGEYPAYEYYLDGKSIDHLFSPQKRSSFLRVKRLLQSRIFPIDMMLISDLAGIACE